MLSKQELESFCLQRQLTTRTCNVIKRIRSKEPSRRVKSSLKNVSCRFPSIKMGCVIQAESHGHELAAVYTWEHDSRVHEFYDQPEPLKLSYRKGNRTIAYQHTADFFLIADHFIGWVECKTEEELESLGKQYPERFSRIDGEWISPPGRAFAEQFGLGYAIRSSQENDWAVIRNLHFLQDYLEFNCPPVTDRQRGVAQRLFTAQSCHMLFELLRADESMPPDAIYKMIASGDLYVDLSSCHLSEPTSVKVYRDVLTAKVLHEQILISARGPRLGNLSFEPGDQLLWKGTQWRVGCRHDSHVDLVSQQGRMLSLAWSSIDELLDREELIAVALTDEQGASEVVASRIMKSSSQMLAQAKQRLEMLEGKRPAASRSLRRFRQHFRAAEMTLGNGFVGLIDRTADKGNRQRKLPEKTIQLMHEVLRTHYLNDNNASLNISYAELCVQCEEQGLIAPSTKTFSAERRHICGPHQEKRIREGHKAAYNLQELVWTGKGGFPPHGERPFDVVHIDHTEVDLMFLGVGEKDEKSDDVGRVWLSVMIDAYSRMVLAYYMSFDPPNYTNCMMLIRQCVQRHHRLPSTIVVDGGKDFASEYFEVLLASLMITKKTRPPHSPRYGSVMERLFGVLNTGLWHNLKGNTKLLRDPRACSASHDPRKLAVWTLDRAEHIFERWLKEVYEVSEHSTLLAKPRQIFEAGQFEAGERAHKRQPYNEAFLVHCLPQTKQSLQRVHVGRGIKHFGIYYWNEAFRHPSIVSSKGVAVRYDPFDLSTIYAYVDGTWLRCRSREASRYENKTERDLRHEASALRYRQGEKPHYHRATTLRTGHFYRSVRQEEQALVQEKVAVSTVATPNSSFTSIQSDPVVAPLTIYEDF